ncbi:hypothetical protein JRQ81_004544 [Phrynocephalus forsythii]|uniref:Uncharacterized protein n=1 Tax=Phrynocephalus forsythii TaxID=171643 RepID=A0A9Q1AUN8_9SAUR|nr:hypothetical protein JRQ81_004544 [Phrynocephalus forsythii]
MDSRAQKNNNRGKLPELTSNNFPKWTLRLMIELEAQDIIASCVKDEEPSGDGENAWKRQNGKAKFIIVCSLKDKQLHYIKDCETAKEMICKLEEAYGVASQQSQVALLRRLCELRLNNKRDSEKHISEFIDLETNLKHCKVRWSLRMA